MARVFANPTKLKHSGKIDNSTCAGKEIVLTCGAFAQAFVLIDQQSSTIKNASYISSGCSVMIAMAEAICEEIVGKSLTELRGLDEITGSTNDCESCVRSAFRKAFVELRQKRSDSFIGDSPLICSCFGVTERKIEQFAVEHRATTVGEIGDVCNAGTGCGSCRMLIDEILSSVNGVN